MSSDCAGAMRYRNAVIRSKNNEVLEFSAYSAPASCYVLRHALPPVVPTMPRLLIERRHTSVRSTLISLTLEREHLLPVVLHADDDPAALLRLVIERLGEGADPGVGQPLGRSVGILARRIVVQHEHREPHAGARLRIFQHLLIAGRVAE